MAKKYGLPDAGTVRWFVKWHKKNYAEDVEQPCKTEDAELGSSNSKQISKQLKEANLKIAGLEMLIETAQRS